MPKRQPRPIVVLDKDDALIIYNRLDEPSGRFSASFDGEPLGYYASQALAQVAIDDCRFDLIERGLLIVAPIMAIIAGIQGGEPQ